jgi:group I intron endonuclease
VEVICYTKGKNDMIGIYKIENLITGHVYIGQSINIHKRWLEHRSAAFNKNTPLYETQLYKAIRKYGIDKFNFSVLEELSESEYSTTYMNELEKKYITKYNSYKNGYNATPSGEYGVSQKGEINGNSKMTQEDVFNIREMYAKHIPHREAYKLFESKISYSGFTKIWTGNNWLHVHMDVYTDENKKFHKTLSKKLSRNQVHNAKLTESEVDDVQALKRQGKRISEVYQHYKDKISFGGFEHIWYNR